MVNITDGNKTFWQVEQIYIGDMHLQDKKYFGLEGIVNIQADLYGPLRVAAIKNSKMVVHRKYKISITGFS